MLGLGPVGLCAVQVALAAGAGPVFAIDTVEQRLEVAHRFGARAIHLTEESPREVIRRATAERGVDVAIDAVGHPDALDLAIRLARRPGPSSRSGCTPSPARSTWGSSGSRR